MVFFVQVGQTLRHELQARGHDGVSCRNGVPPECGVTAVPFCLSQISPLSRQTLQEWESMNVSGAALTLPV